MDYIDIEEEIIGNILLKPELIKKIVISEQHFLDNNNKFIFKLLKKQYEEEKTISIVSIPVNYKHLFNDRFRVDDIIQKMTNIISNIYVDEGKFDYYQEVLFSRYIENKILNIIKQYQNQKISSNEMLTEIHKYENMSIKTEEHKLSKDEIYKIISSKNKNINLRFKKLSDAANIQEHDLVVVAARPGIGKTGFILNILEDISDKYNCLLFNMEMSEKQVYQRLVSINTKIAMQYHDNPETEHQRKKIEEGCTNLSNKKIKMFNQGQTIASLRRRIINECKNEHTICFIDYVGLIGTSEKTLSLYEKVTSIVKELRQISLDYNCTIFLVSQLNRNSVKEKEPKISDLKESGELEQSATTVIMLHDENHDKNLSKKEIEVSVIIGKNRNGRLGIAKLNYNKSNQRFDEITRNINSPNDWRKE